MTALSKLANASAGHARLGPSGAKKWMTCAGSLVLEAEYPNESNEYADAGTACHTIAARCLETHTQAAQYLGEAVSVNRGDEPLRVVEIDDEHVEWIQQYVDSVRFHARAAGATLWVEQQVDTSDWLGIPDQFGTADAEILTPYLGPDAQANDVELQSHDAKFGRTPVKVEGNPQLMLYALGFITELLRATPPKPVDTAPLREMAKRRTEDDEDETLY